MENFNPIEWNDDYSLEQAKIDNEHKKLFEIANEIYRYKYDSRRLLEIIVELKKSSKAHFDFEETFMKVNKYKFLAEHTLLHKKILLKLDKIAQNTQLIEPIKIVQIMTSFIYEDILQHMLKEDKKFYFAMKSKNNLREVFSWNEKLETKDKLIDSQHYNLFKIAIKTLDYKGDDLKSHIKETINELYTYMNSHFKHEESFMEDIEYPNLEEHKKIHLRIVSEMNELIKSLPNSKIEDFEEKLIEFINIWMVNHVLEDDSKIVEYQNTL